MSDSSDATVSARVWTIPDPVKDNALYQVGFEAGCDCTSRVFSISGPEIALIYPNSYQPESTVSDGKRVLIPSTPTRPFKMRAVGGEGIDVLKLLVVEGELGFPVDRSELWVATPEHPDRIEELVGLLDRLEGGASRWGVATAPLQIVP